MIIPALVFFSVVTLIAPVLGQYIASVYRYDYVQHEHLKNNTGFWQSQTASEYFRSLIIFNLVCITISFLIIYFQNYLVFSVNKEAQQISFAAGLNAAISFSTGTFWQSHDPESELTMLSHIFAMTMQNFLSGATGIAVFIAFVRGIINSKNPYIGNFYDDFLRAIIFILLPIALFAGFNLITCGVPQSFAGEVVYETLQDANQQTMYIGPVAAQVAIKNLIANGGSFFSSASAHPFEAPSRTAIMLGLFLIVTIQSGMIFAYGFLVDARKLSWTLHFIVILIMTISLFLISQGEGEYGVPLILENSALKDNFNYNGKEMIYDKFPSLMWVLSITMSSDGSPNACLENYSPFSTLVLFSNLIISKFVIESASSGFFAMLSYLIVAVFLRGMMTGETANFFGKRITINEINYVIIVFLIVPVGVLLFTSITLMLSFTDDLIDHHGSQAITDVTYNFASSFVGNGSDFTGLDVSTDYFNYMTAIAMFIGRYGVIYFSLAISGSFSNKQRINRQINTRVQSSIELGFFLLITVILVGSIMFLPLIMVGPLVEYINL